MTMIKAITLKQPWADLVVSGVKNIENRTWKTAHRGTLAIHASRTHDQSVANDYKDVLSYAPLQCIVGVVDIIDVIHNATSKWAIPGHYHWVLGNPRMLCLPIPMKGNLGLWECSFNAQDVDYVV